jgi:hypothetical protein
MPGGLVRTFVKISVLPVAAFVVACGRGNPKDQTGLSADLKRDLAAASASSVELASTSREYQPARFVSAIESPATSAPVQRRKVRHPVVRQHGCKPAGRRQGARSFDGDEGGRCRAGAVH